MGECQCNLQVPFWFIGADGLKDWQTILRPIDFDRSTEQLTASDIIAWHLLSIWSNHLGYLNIKVTIDWPLARPDQLDSSRAEMIIDDKQ